MTHGLLRALRAEGNLHTMVHEAMREALEPLVGAPVSLLRETTRVWVPPPSALALATLAESTLDGFQTEVFVGGRLEDLQQVASVLVGQPLGQGEEMFQDCLREVANILAGRIQERLHTLGSRTTLGLPTYLASPRRLPLAGRTGSGIALQVRAHLAGDPVLVAGIVERR